MAHSFDPYYQWLDFEPGQTPADYYQLLGIDPQENDPAVISLAADRLTAKIRGNRPGE
ncbi:MAG: hypothetical protein HQ581_20950, partial [Planctomycetes bacterium]|nr:hypothetical protein [Planctomycetota bacterium]